MTLLGPCPPYWQYYEQGHKCFFMSTYQIKGSAARAECQKMDADLTTISDSNEMDFVYAIASVTLVTLSARPHTDCPFSKQILTKN